MRLLVTGSRGTLGGKLLIAAQDRGWEVVAWDRDAVAPDDAVAGARFVADAAADAILHLAVGSEDWAGRLATLAGPRPFVHVSSAMVFDHEPDGPHAPADERTARDDYGRYKVRCEDAVRAANAGATIARIGWQIDAGRRGNNMLFALDGWQAREGCIRTSRAWRPACSFMDDTIAALLDLAANPQPGVVHLDSNAAEAHTFDAIAAALKSRFERAHWHIDIGEHYRHDQRLVGGPLVLPPLSLQLPELQSW